MAALVPCPRDAPAPAAVAATPDPAVPGARRSARPADADERRRRRGDPPWDRRDLAVPPAAPRLPPATAPICVGSAAGGLQLLAHLHAMVRMIASEFAAALPWPVGLAPHHRSRTEDRS